jgi:hypothetical protein
MEATSGTFGYGVRSATGAVAAKQQLAGHRNGEAQRPGRPHEPARRWHRHVPVRRGTRLKLGRPTGGVQAGWQTSSERLAAADSGWFSCETADVVVERRGEAHRRHDSRRCQHEHGHLRPEAWLTLRLGRQATGGATTTTSEFQRGLSSALRPAGSVLPAAGHRNGEGATARATTEPAARQSAVNTYLAGLHCGCGLITRLDRVPKDHSPGAERLVALDLPGRCYEMAAWHATATVCFDGGNQGSCWNLEPRGRWSGALWAFCCGACQTCYGVVPPSAQLRLDGIGRGRMYPLGRGAHGSLVLAVVSRAAGRTS